MGALLGLGRRLLIGTKNAKNFIISPLWVKTEQAGGVMVESIITGFEVMTWPGEARAGDVVKVSCYFAKVRQVGKGIVIDLLAAWCVAHSSLNGPSASAALAALAGAVVDDYGFREVHVRAIEDGLGEFFNRGFGRIHPGPSFWPAADLGGGLVFLTGDQGEADSWRDEVVFLGQDFFILFFAAVEAVYDGLFFRRHVFVPGFAVGRREPVLSLGAEYIEFVQ